MSGGRREAGCASVAVPVPVRRLFTYRVPERLRERLEPGTPVRVPFGPRRLRGTVIEYPVPEPEDGVELREIEATLDAAPRLPAAVLGLTGFVADYYLCSRGDAVATALPPDPGGGSRERRVRLRPGADPDALPLRARARRRVLETLPADGTAVPLGSLAPADRRAVPALARLGLVAVEDRALPVADPVDGAAAAVTARGPVEPTAAQREVLRPLGEAIEAERFAPFLLFGATGSGKTEVYLRAAERVLAGGGGVLYLVPEIGLTPLLVGQIAHRFPNQVALLHSALSRRQRFESWERVRRGERRLVVGTRSAVFAPVAGLRLIVVDEEQDGSYKQEETPRYNGRDLAVVRAREEHAVVLLGSATPSLESFQHATAGRYRLLRLGGRVERRPLPTVDVVDMRREFERHGEIRPLSEPLVIALRECLGRGEQALVLRNRRGWAAALLCPRCGERVSCRQCSLAMTWHRAERRLRCHTCALEAPYPEACPTCAAEELKQLGEGTERIEDDLRRAVPGARIERLDRDTTRRKGVQQAILQRFARRELDVLVGTQMIAKGHDFPDVTLVGVLSADQSLGIPDFRAAERTFQLLTQVAGRAGRGRQPGRVVVQAFDPEHPVVGLAASQDYEAFFDREIRYRRALRYPPLTGLVRITIHDREELRAREWAERLAEALRDASAGRLLLAGPGPAPIERIKGRHRQQILARSAGRRRLVGAVDAALAAVEGHVPSRALQVDVDPYSLL